MPKGGKKMQSEVGTEPAEFGPVRRRTEGKQPHNALAIDARHADSPGDRIQRTQISVRARYVTSYVSSVGRLKRADNFTQGVAVFLIAVGSLGRVCIAPELETMITKPMIRGLVHLQRNAGKQINISFMGEPEAPCDTTRSTDEDYERVGKTAAILLKTVLCQASHEETYDRAMLSVSRIKYADEAYLTGVSLLLAHILTEKREFVWRSMVLRSQLLLMASYAHLDGSITFARNTGGMADHAVRDEIISRVRTKLLMVIGKAVYIGNVPSVYHCWAYLISPIPIDERGGITTWL